MRPINSPPPFPEVGPHTPKPQRALSHTRPPTTTPTPNADAVEAFEQTLCQVRTVHVFKIPPRVTSGGYRAGDWKDEVRVCLSVCEWASIFYREARVGWC